MDNCYSATYMSQTRDQQRFTVSEVAADWHEPMVPQRLALPHHISKLFSSSTLLKCIFSVKPAVVTLHKCFLTAVI